MDKLTEARRRLELAKCEMIQETKDLIEMLRSTTIESMNIVDGEVDTELKDIVDIASTLAKAPIAAIHLISGEYQHSVVNKGLAGPKTTPREKSICNLTIQDPTGPLVITDAATKQELIDNPWVNGELDTINFYAGVPLVTDDGIAIGALCVIDRQSRDVDTETLESLEKLGRLATGLLLQRIKNDAADAAVAEADAAALVDKK